MQAIVSKLCRFLAACLKLRLFPVYCTTVTIHTILLGVATKYCQILYFATCFCFVLALLLLALSFSFLIALLTNFSSGVSNALKALDRASLTFCLLGIATSYGG